MAGEQRRDALEEGRLGERAGGREEAEDGPLDAVGERDRRGLPVRRVGQPPAAGLDLDEPRVARPGQLVADEREQALDGVLRRLAAGRRPGRGDRGRRRRADDPVRAGRARRAAARRAGAAAVRGSSRDSGAGRSSGSVEADRCGARRRRQPAELAGAVEADQDLAEEPLVAGRLAPGAQGLDRDVGDGPRGLRRGERAAGRSARAARTGRGPGTRSGSPAPPGDRRQADVGAGPRPRRPSRARRQELDRPRRRRRRRRPAGRSTQPVAGAPTPPRTAADERLRPAVDEQDDPPVAGHRRRRPPRSARPIAAACQLHGAPQRRPDQRRRSAAATRPRGRGPRRSRGTPHASRSRLGRTGGWPRTRRIRGGGGRPAVRRRRRRAGARRPDGLDERRGPPSRSPRRGCAGPRRAAPGAAPARPPSSRWTKPRTSRNAVLEREPRVALAPLGRRRAAGRARRRSAAPAVRPGLRRQPARRQDRVQEGQPQGGEHRGGAQVALDPLEDRGQPDQLARRVEVEQLVDEASRAPSTAGNRSRSAARTSSTPTSASARARSSSSSGRLALLASRRAGRGRRCSGSGGRSGAARRPAGSGARRSTRPDDLVDDERPAAGGAAGRVQVADRDLEARLAARRGGHPLERGVEVADVRRPQDDLGEHPGQRARLERDRRGAAGRPPRGRPSRRDRTGRRRRRRRSSAARSAPRPGPAGGGGANRSNAGSEKPGSEVRRALRDPSSGRC